MPTLNVIFHGLVAMQARKDDILALLPSLPGTHVHRLGEWLGEMEIPHRTDYRLSGVEPGGAGFDPSTNLFLGPRELAPDFASRIQAAMVFPKPDQIRSLRLVPVEASDFEGADAALFARARALPTIQIFVYRVTGTTAAVRVENHTWEPPAVALDSLNLHIFSEEESLNVAEHAPDAFERSASLFLGVDLKLLRPKAVPDFTAEEARQLPPGVHPLELDDLAVRLPKLVGTGRALLAEPPDVDALLQQWGLFVPSGRDLRACSFAIAEAP